jgi:hypothetical protein
MYALTAFVEDLQLERNVSSALLKKRAELRLVEGVEEAASDKQRVHDEAQDGEVVDAARVRPEEPEKDLVPLLGPDPLGGDINVLNAGVLPCEGRDGTPERGIPRERAVAAEEQDLARGVALCLRVPRQEPIDVRVRPQAFRILLRYQIQPSGPELRMVDGGQRVEDGAVDRPADLRGDVVGRLLAELAQNDAGLRFQRGDRPVLQVKHEHRRNEGGGDGEVRPPKSGQSQCHMG